MKNATKAQKLLCLGLAVILVFSLIACLLQTNGGKVKITEIKLPTAMGEFLCANVYKPVTATIDNPAPCVVTAPGAGNNKEMQDMTAIELSKRGVVVVAIDIYHHGNSTGTHESVSYNMSQQYLGHGMMDMVEYVYNNLDYVDKTQIGITGHSTGGRVCSYTLNEYGRYDRIQAGIEDGAHYYDELFEASRSTMVSSALIVSNVPAAYIIENFPDYIDIGMLMSYYDEGIYSQVTQVEGYRRSDMTVSPEAKNFINQGVPGSFTMTKDVNYDVDAGAASAAGNFTGFTAGTAGYPQVTLSGWDSNEKIELEKWYVNEETGGRRIVYQPKVAHAECHFNPLVAEDIVHFFTESMDLPNPVKGHTTYFWKEVANLGALVGLFIFIYGLILVMLDTKTFGVLLGKAPELAPAPDKKGKIKILVSILITTLVGALTVEWAMELGANFSKLAPKLYTSWTGNGIGGWTLFMGLFSAALFLVSYFLFDKKAGVKSENWGLKISLEKLVKTILFTVVMFFIVYGVMYFCFFFFQTDFRFFVYSIKTVSKSEFMYLFWYFPIFFVYYVVHSWTVNATYRFQTKKARTATILAVVSVVAAPILGLLIEYVGIYVFDKVIWPKMWVYYLWLLAISVNLGLATLLSRKLFEKTGNIWLGAFINATLATYITIATSRMITFLH